MDRSVLDEVITQVEPLDEALRAGVRARLASHRLGRLGEVAAELAGMRRRAGAPTERKVVVAVAAGDALAPLREAAAGHAALATLCRAADARMLLVDAGVAGGGELELSGVIALRAGDGVEPGQMSETQALIAVQSGIALALSLASEGLDVLALGDLGRADGRGLSAALSAQPPLAALQTAGGLQHGLGAGLCLAAAAMRLPVILDGAGADAAGRLAGALAPHALAYQLPVSAIADLGAGRGDGSGAAAVLPLVDAAARLARELG